MQKHHKVVLRQKILTTTLSPNSDPLLSAQSVTTAVALQQGMGSPLFAACVCFSLIVMYDAMGVRQHAGERHTESRCPVPRDARLKPRGF